MTTVKAYCGLARLELAQPESRRKLDLARDHIEAGLSMVKEILPNSINEVELLIVRGDMELIEKNGEFVKKQQCKKATRVKRFNSYSGQRWKLDNNKKLENKKGVWKSDDLWIFKPKGDDMIYIENTAKAKVLGATSNGKKKIK